MTKYEWESELKKNIHRLPESEIARVMEYYNELFEDKIEGGLSERAVISEFGNPVDVADKILSEFDFEINAPKQVYSKKADTREDDLQSKDKKEKESAEHKKADEHKKSEVKTNRSFSAGRMAVFIILCVFIGGAIVGLFTGVWGAMAGFFAASGAMIGAGAITTVYGVIVAFGQLGQGLATCSVGLITLGLGTVWMVVNIKLVKLLAKLTVKLVKMCKNFLFVKREAIYEI